MRAISCAIISFVMFYIFSHARPQEPRDINWIGFGLFISILFLIASIVLMMLGL